MSYEEVKRKYSDEERAYIRKGYNGNMFFVSRQIGVHPEGLNAEALINGILRYQQRPLFAGDMQIVP